ncbi:MAG: protein-L-isoaspartate(D-aspartate) O-methyltransferase [Xanthomonadaceae bacterium]|nr:protein-L-isoaspartate(D-aspartate) O-methyltransferase [Xanthomonadaceae bacterium]MDP2186477.1 protein-L-isoaspartate(D-aspartate) O-methyltransferase [Xanthomonadales bacterium]MDZ4117397.1 protein-L-isoaspartate(D-aspartate) O-methyltransferase [Xanthomonadaceae bacterium]MDZ4379601.1 protein-L-isoaspartate(D-aspartate) O-methyltransferase [Xanthomonadaceae bacterium]
MSPGNALSPEALGLGMTSQRARDRMIENLRAQGGISDERVLNAMRQLPRHLFIDEALASRAYENTALPIGHSQTISQPWVVARMTQALLEFGQPQRVLEIGTGSGYQAALLALLVDEVCSIERIDELLRQARRRLRRLGFAKVRCRHDDGSAGWPELAPFDAIIVTAGAQALDPALFEQLAPGGVLVAPVGGRNGQQLLRFRRDADGISEEVLAPVVFVPLLPGLA